MDIPISEKKKRIYNLWRLMVGRCHNENFKNYYSSTYYRLRGISVCDEWRFDYFAFKKWAYENGYNDSLSIDRIDPDGNYCPSNCRFIPLSENRKLSRRRFSFPINHKHEWMVVYYSSRSPFFDTFGKVFKTSLTKPEARSLIAQMQANRTSSFDCYECFRSYGRLEGQDVYIPRLYEEHSQNKKRKDKNNG